MRSGSTTSYAVALAAAACLVLSGCTDGDATEPTASPSSSGSATSSGSASPSPSASASASASESTTASVPVPAAARAHTEAGAIEFAKFYMLEADKAFVTLDSTVLQAIAEPTCKNCELTISGVADQKKAGERQVRPSITVKATNPLPGGTPDRLDVQVMTQDAAVNIVNKQGAVVDTVEAGQSVYRARVSWSAGRWTMSEVVFER